jgi:transposase-like protein
MNNLSPSQYAFAAVGFLASTLVAAGLGSAIDEFGLTSSNAASWVQAFGATAGIGIAIWVPYKQNRDARTAEADRQRESTKRLCEALRDELLLTKFTFDSEHYKELLRENVEHAYNFNVPKATHAFPIYHAMIGRLTEIDNGTVRRAIIIAYGAYYDLLEALEFNDGVLDESISHYRNRKELKEKLGQVEYDLLAANYKARLTSLRTDLRESAKALIDSVAAAIELLNVECGNRLSVIPTE